MIRQFDDNTHSDYNLKNYFCGRELYTIPVVHPNRFQAGFVTNKCLVMQPRTIGEWKVEEWDQFNVPDVISFHKKEVSEKLLVIYTMNQISFRTPLLSQTLTYIDTYRKNGGIVIHASAMP